MSKILFSFIIPVYNRENLIHESINSILKSDFKNYEIILIDDASADNSPEICKNYEREYPFIKTVCLNKNRGPGYARNIGIDLAKGEWIYFLDSDDLICTENLSDIANKINNINSNFDIVACNTIINYNNINKNKNKNYLLNNEILSSDNFLELYPEMLRFPLWFFIFRKELLTLNTLKLPEDMYIFEDSLFMLYAFKYIKYILVETKNICISRRYIVDNSLSNINNRKTYELPCLEKYILEICNQIEIFSNTNNLKKRKVYRDILCRWSLDVINRIENNISPNNTLSANDLNFPLSTLKIDGTILFLSKLFFTILNQFKNISFYLAPASRCTKLLLEKMIDNNFSILGFFDTYNSDPYITKAGNTIYTYSSKDVEDICKDNIIIISDSNIAGAELKRFFDERNINSYHWILKEDYYG